MKKILLAILILSISASSVVAQHDVKVNLFGAFFKDFGVGYEYIINDQLSAGVFINSVSGTPFLGVEQYFDGYEGFNYSAFKISPEFRYYTSPDFGADKRYYSAYLRYSTENFTNLDYESQNDITGEYTTMPYSFKNNRITVGLTTGSKWVLNSGIYIESLWGVGRSISTSPTFSTPDAEDYIKGYSDDLSNYDYYSEWDFRLQISIGYRFGGY